MGHIYIIKEKRLKLNQRKVKCPLDGRRVGAYGIGSDETYICFSP